MTSPIFKRLLLGSLLVIVLMMGGLDFYLTRFIVRTGVREVEKRLVAEGKILSAEIFTIPRAQLLTWAKSVATRAGARITVIDDRGLVLADSEHDPDSMENHAGRPEVRQALNGRLGVSLRHSETVGLDMSYVALPVFCQEGPKCVLRLAVPLPEIEATTAEVRRRIIEASAVAALTGLAFAWLFSRFLTQRIQRLTAFAGKLITDRDTGTELLFDRDEFGELARAMSRMASEIRDLMEQSRTELARREAILAGMQEGVLAVDEQQRIVFSNASFAQAVGAPQPVPAKTPLVEVVRHPRLLEILKEVVTFGAPVRARVDLVSARDRTFQVHAVPLATGSSKGALLILYDITDLERLEKIRQDFVANVSHELRTPLAAIRGCAETLLDGALEDQAAGKRFVEMIRAHAIRLNNIASDLLILSELDAGKQVSELERVPVRAAVETAVAMVSSEAHLRGVEIRMGLVEDLEVLGTRLRLEQALVNLIDNAVKFNRPGGIVGVEVQSRSEGKIHIAVTDTGIGIPAKDLPRIFERFYRVDKARSRQMGGTGLGLSIVKHIVENMGGSIQIESRLGKGSTFHVFLPQSRA